MAQLSSVINYFHFGLCSRQPLDGYCFKQFSFWSKAKKKLDCFRIRFMNYDAFQLIAQGKWLQLNET